MSSRAANAEASTPILEDRFERPQTWGELLHWGVRLQIAVISALVLFIYWHEMRMLAIQWWRDSNWSHGMLVPLFSLYFLYIHRDQLARAPVRPNPLGLVVMIISLAVYYAGFYLEMRYPQSLSIVSTIFGIVLLLGGWPIMRVAWFPILFLVFALPIPTRLYILLTHPLRRFASAVAAWILPVIIPGLDAQSSGVAVEYIYGNRSGLLNIEEACAGMRLLMAFITLSVATAYFTERPWWHRLIMIGSCIPIAVFCNILRVLITSLLHIFGRPDLAKGTSHEVLGLAMLPLALAMYAGIGAILNRLFVDDANEDEDSDGPGRPIGPKSAIHA